MAEIPTMECDACEGAGESYGHASDCGAYGACCGGIGVECERCFGTGRIPRRPLTGLEIRRIADGTVVLAQMSANGPVVEAQAQSEAHGYTGLWSGEDADVYLGRADDAYAVWLAEEPA